MGTGPPEGRWCLSSRFCNDNGDRGPQAVEEPLGGPGRTDQGHFWSFLANAGLYMGASGTWCLALVGMDIVRPQPKTASKKKGGGQSTYSWEPERGCQKGGACDALGVGYGRAIATQGGRRSQRAPWGPGTPGLTLAQPARPSPQAAVLCAPREPRGRKGRDINAVEKAHPARHADASARVTLVSLVRGRPASRTCYLARQPKATRCHQEHSLLPFTWWLGPMTSLLRTVGVWCGH